MFTREHDADRREFDWLAVDQQGQLAVLSTAGFGPIPSSLVTHIERIDAALEVANGLPTITSAQPIRVAKDRSIGNWIDYAARGLFAYDWRHGRDVYVLVARPEVPLLVVRAPQDVVSAAELAPRFSASFSRAPEVTPLGVTTWQERTCLS